MVEVQLDTLTRHYGAVVALHPTDLVFARGALTVLVGPSGCGKTTLMRLVAGLDAPSGGQVLFDGRAMAGTPAWGRNVAMVFQNYALYPHMSVFDNIAFPLRAQRTPRKPLRDRVAATAKSLGLDGLLWRKPGQLSGGQQQRVALARAIVREPDVFLLDEPLSNLDAQLRANTRTEIKRLQRSLNVTTLYVTHDQEEALSLADHLVVLRDGRVQQVGAPEDVYRAPANTFVARFIGNPAMTLLPVVASTSVLVLEGAGTLPTPPTLSPALNGARPALLGVRPEAVRLHNAHPEAGGVRVTVDVREPLGREALLTLSLADGTPLRALAAPEAAYAPGTTAWATFEAGGLHLFDAATEARLTAL